MAQALAAETASCGGGCCRTRTPARSRDCPWPAWTAGGKGLPVAAAQGAGRGGLQARAAAPLAANQALHAAGHDARAEGLPVARLGRAAPRRIRTPDGQTGEPITPNCNSPRSPLSASPRAPRCLLAQPAVHLRGRGGGQPKAGRHREPHQPPRPRAARQADIPASAGRS